MGRLDDLATHEAGVGIAVVVPNDDDKVRPVDCLGARAAGEHQEEQEPDGPALRAPHLASLALFLASTRGQLLRFEGLLGSSAVLHARGDDGLQDRCRVQRPIASCS